VPSRLRFAATRRAPHIAPSGNAGCTNAPAALRATKKNTQASHHRYAETIRLRHSLREWFTAYTCSPWCAGLASHRGLRIARKFDLSVGRPGPHDFAVRRSCRTPGGPSASIASCTQRLWRLRKRPSVMGQDGRSKATELPDGASVLSVTGELTRGIALNDLVLSAFWRGRFHRDEGTRKTLPATSW